jgi:hypothetical protein
MYTRHAFIFHLRMMGVTDFDLIIVLSARTQQFHEDLQAERYKSSLEVVEVPP